VKHFI